MWPSAGPPSPPGALGHEARRRGSTWASSRPRVCSGICTAGAPTEPASGGSSSAPGLDNELIASTTTVTGTGPNVASSSAACSSSTTGRPRSSIDRVLHTTATRSVVHFRGLETFKTIEQDSARKVVELTIGRSVPDLSEFESRVKAIGGPEPSRIIWP